MSKKYRLRIIIITMYLGLLVIPMGIWGILNTKLITKEVNQFLTENSRVLIQKQMEGFDNLYIKANEIAVQLMLDRNVRKELLNYTGDLDIQGVENYNNIKYAMENVMIQHTEYSGIGILSEQVKKSKDDEKKEEITAGYLGNIHMAEKPDWYLQANYIFDVPYFIQYLDPQTKESGVGMIFMIAYKDINTNEKLGTLCIKTPYKTIEKILSVDSTLGAQQVVYDEKGNVIYDTIEENEVRKAIESKKVYEENYFLSYDCTVGKQDYLILKANSSISKIHITYAIPKESVFHAIDEIQALSLIIGAFCLVFSMVIIFVIWRKIFVPLSQIQKEMEKVEQGNYNIEIPNYSMNEIGKLANSFECMIESMKEKNHQIREDEKKKREYEIKILQAQINPHFLYNTLDSIKWIALSRGEKTIEKMTYALIHLLRKTISDDKEFVSIHEELENIQYYIEIQKFRYYDSFDFEIFTDKDCQEAFIPRLTLQPLVENALFHGIYNCGRRGKITIVLKKEKQGIKIDIIDNGKGMDRKEEKDENSRRKGESMSGIGIKNVNERLKLYFGESYGISFESKKDEFTKITVYIPFITELEKHGG